MNDYYPKRIICLTEETTETLYLLGEQDRIVGISGFTVRPKLARKEKPKISTFLDAKYQEIIDLKPDLVIGFSDIQANIAKELIKQGITVWVNNHRSVNEIINMMVQLGCLVGKQELAIQIVNKINQRINQIVEITNQWENKPKVYFEEWYDPIISSIEWVGDLIEIVGGKNIFHDKSKYSLAKDRIIKDHKEIIEKNPDIIIGSWCGKKFQKKKVKAREGWNNIKAIKNEQIFEINSSIILQPGPAALTDGLEALFNITNSWYKKTI